MKAQESTRTYAYHFAKLADKNNIAFSSAQDTQEFETNFSKFSFRYFAQCQQNQKRVNQTQVECTQMAALPQKSSQLSKKYTFSGLAKQQKPFRKSEDTQYVRSAALTPKYPFNMNRTFRNTETIGPVVENGEQQVFQKHTKQEIKKENRSQGEYSILKTEKISLQSEMCQLKAQNQLLRVRFNQTKKYKQIHQQSIKNLKIVIKQAQLQINELKSSVSLLKNEKQVLKASYNEAKKNFQNRDSLKSKNEPFSKTIQYHLIVQADQLTKAEQQTTKLDTSEYEQAYQQIKKLLLLDINLVDCHERVVKEIKKLICLSDQNASLRATKAEVEKQKARLLHHFKKKEAELAKICNQNAFLSAQLQKASSLIQNCNEQINLLNMRQIQRRLIAKQSLND